MTNGEDRAFDGQAASDAQPGPAAQASPAPEEDTHTKAAADAASQQAASGAGARRSAQPEPEAEAEPTVIRDRRRIDPITGQRREPATPSSGGAPSSATAPGVASQGQDEAALGGAAADLAAERLADLQRLQAEYVNYRKRVDRDRDLARERGVAAVLESLLPVLDDLDAARAHGELTGPLAAIAEKLDGALGRHGLVRYGEAGSAFDPAIHEAFLHSETDDVSEPTVSQVLQAGYLHKDKVLRAARVAVTAPVS